MRAGLRVPLPQNFPHRRNQNGQHAQQDAEEQQRVTDHQLLAQRIGRGLAVIVDAWSPCVMQKKHRNTTANRQRRSAGGRDIVFSLAGRVIVVWRMGGKFTSAADRPF